jgi:2-polyprenyl-3-methyl-5-hydroxy-6-metoxy-1,4-benzoquinol methylase
MSQDERPEDSLRDRDRIRLWHEYYSDKRMAHHAAQLDLVGKYHRSGRILEIGPGFGLMTAALANAGHEIATLDVIERDFAFPDVRHLQRDLTAIAPGDLDEFDTILCCETLEHIQWDSVGKVLKSFHRDGRVLIVSVPYEAFQMFFSFYINRYAIQERFALKKLRFLKRFRPVEGYMHHKWEVGYRGNSLAEWEAKIKETGWRIVDRRFPPSVRSVFHVLRPA